MKKPSTPRIKSGVRHLFHTAKTRIEKWYEEFSDILDSDEDRLSLQYNHYSGKPARFFPKSLTLKWRDRRS